MKRKLEFDNGKKVFPIIMLALGVIIMLLQLITRQNIIAIVSAGYCCIAAAVILLSIIIKKKVYLTMLAGYLTAGLGTFLFHVIWGADAGFGALISGKAGFSSAEHPLITGEGNFFTRLGGNLLIALPGIVFLALIFVFAKKAFKSDALKKVLCGAMSFLLVGS